MKKEICIRELGWNSDEIATLNYCGNWEWTDSYGTQWEYDADEDKSRHCGSEAACFWTDWQ